MKLRQIVIMAIKGNTDIRRQLKDVLKISEPTLFRLIKNNSDDLTKAAALQVIRKETGLTDEEILEQETITEPQETKQTA